MERACPLQCPSSMFHPSPRQRMEHLVISRRHSRFPRVRQGRTSEPMERNGSRCPIMGALPQRWRCSQSTTNTVTTSPQQSPHLDYSIYLPRAGEIEVSAIIAPTQNLLPGRDLRLAVSIDDNVPQMVDAGIASAIAKGQRWGKLVADNAQTLTFRQTVGQPGRHTLRVWMVDPDVVLEYLVVGEPKPSYFGPPALTVGPSY